MLVDATYYANYEDYTGFDEVPCVVDSKALEVVEFKEPVFSRWGEPGIANIMCVREVIVVGSPIDREFVAIKEDEWADIADYGDYAREEIILFDNDMLTMAMEKAALPAIPPTEILTAGQLAKIISSNGLENIPVYVGCEGYVNLGSQDCQTHVSFDGYRLLICDSCGGYPF